MTTARQLVDKLWSYCDVLRDDGVGVIEYTEQLTYLLFLKMADERAKRPLKAERIIPEEYSWDRLVQATGNDLELEYTRILNGLAREEGVIGTIFRKAQNRVTDPAKLRRLVVDLGDFVGEVALEHRAPHVAARAFDQHAGVGIAAQRIVARGLAGPCGGDHDGRGADAGGDVPGVVVRAQ